MPILTAPRRLLCAALVAGASLGSAASAQAAADDQAVCDVRLERLESQFYDMADRRSYEAAVEWWDARWQAYHESCVMH